ncbi:MAG: DUF697 domain-containing protein [Rhodocyclaceae bacterium]|jgi:uncharacterized protein (DUF697 family)|nr:DUF697 domain-containing protein [Rhodocyclaceae bacterium]
MDKSVQQTWSDALRTLRRILLDPAIDTTELDRIVRAGGGQASVPVVWLLGKAQAGKTSIIRALTGSPAAEIGNGFQPCTRTARLYDHPAEAPAVRFLDTRGLGELAYDPDEDIRYCEAQAHLVLAVMKVADPAQDAVFDTLHAVRERHPEWPLLIAQTGLHELYPAGAAHVLPYPWHHDGDRDPPPHRLPGELGRALAAQRKRFGRPAGGAEVRWVPIDLTLPEDGFAPCDYGLEALWCAIEALSSVELREPQDEASAVRDLYARTAHQHITGYALSAAGLGALPVIDLVAVSAVQAKLLHSLAHLYGQRWSRRLATEFLGLLGAGLATGMLAHMAARGAAKLIPGWGQTAGALWSAGSAGAVTFALGKAAAAFLAAHREGRSLDAEALRAIYRAALERAASWIEPRTRGPRQ